MTETSLTLNNLSSAIEMIMQATSDTRIYSSKRLSVLFVEIIILHLYAVTTTSELECSAHAELMNHAISKKQNAKPIT